MFRPEIQGLRALAIMLVFAAHAGIPTMSGGFIGVDVFFVISGFLITGIITKQISDTGTIKFAEFYIRRLKRLLPALLVVVFFTTIVSSVILSKYETTEQTASALSAATLTSNFYFALSNVDYFSELRARDFFLHTWSLAVEEQFYLLWPALVLLATRTLGQTNTAGMKVFFALAIISGYTAFLGLTATYPLHAYYLMPSRAWEFFVGGWVYLYTQQNLSRSGRLLPHLATAGLTMVVGSAFFMTSDYPGKWLLVPVVGSALVLVGGSAGITFRLLSNPIMKWIGDRSYSLYLWHWPVLVMAKSFGLGDEPFELLIIALLVVVLSMASYRWIELPIWKGSRWQSLSNAKVMAAALASVIVVAAGPIANSGRISQNLQSDEAKLANAARKDKPALYKMGCDSWYDSSELNPCWSAERSETKKTVVLVGDSIGAQWAPILPEVFDNKEWNTVVLTKSSCPVVDEDYFYTRIGKMYSVCSNWREKAVKFIESIQPDIVILGSSSGYSFTPDQWINGTSRILRRISTDTNRIFILNPTPTMTFDGPACIERYESMIYKQFNMQKSACRERAKDDLLPTELLAQAAAEFKNTKIIDMNSTVCPDGYCSAKSPDGVFVFRDTQHLTVSFVKSISALLGRKIINGDVVSSAVISQPK